ncbi:hypothetical protein DUI70_0023 [Streptomyces albus]|nr:hypothetical protein DUI70_0023 [Streptomyces albus]
MQPDGSARTVDVPTGINVMKAAVARGIPGIVAECGGSMMCATCHVYVADDDVEAVPAVGEEEDALLEATASPRSDASRLGCQLIVTDELDGLTVLVPESQL